VFFSYDKYIILKQKILKIIYKSKNVMRNKLPENEKRKSITTTIDSKINNMLEEWMKDNNYDNKSKVIEKLILNEINKQKKSE